MYTIPTFTFKNIGRKEKLVDIFIWHSPYLYRVEQAHCHDYHEILIIENGDGNHRIDGVLNPLLDHSFHVVPRFFAHQMLKGKETKGFTIAISPIFIDQLSRFDSHSNYQALFSKAQIINLAQEEFNSFQFFLKEITKTDYSESYKQNICAAILLKLLPFIAKEPGIENDFSREVRKALEQNYMKRLSTAQYATQFNLSTSSFNTKIKKITGKTIMQMQDDLLLNNIKRLLYNNEVSLKEIAFEHGFIDYAHFSKFFKKHTTFSPIDYRKTVNNVQEMSNN